MEANVFAPLIINQMVVPAMIAQGGGIFIMITSGAAYGTPANPAGKGGYGLGYGYGCDYRPYASYYRPYYGSGFGYGLGLGLALALGVGEGGGAPVPTPRE